MKKGLAIRESKERRKDCFLELREKSRSGQRKVSRERVGRKGEREEKRVFCCFRRELKKGEDPRGPVGSSFW